jgi:hypothetical protein
MRRYLLCTLAIAAAAGILSIPAELFRWISGRGRQGSLPAPQPLA